MEQQITPYHHLPGSIVFPSGLLILIVLFLLEPLHISIPLSGLFFSKIQNEHINNAEGTIQQLFSFGILLVDREHFTNLNWFLISFRILRNKG